MTLWDVDLAVLFLLALVIWCNACLTQIVGARADLITEGVAHFGAPRLRIADL